MRNYDVILFDLDGTLTDSAPGILNSVRYACRKLGLPIPGEETLRRFLGPPLIASFRELMGPPTQTAPSAPFGSISPRRVCLRTRSTRASRPCWPI